MDAAILVNSCIKYNPFTLYNLPKEVTTHHNMATTATAARMSDRTTMRERRVSASMRCNISSAQGCAQPHSMPKIQMYRSREDRKYHSAPHMTSVGQISRESRLQDKLSIGVGWSRVGKDGMERGWRRLELWGNKEEGEWGGRKVKSKDNCWDHPRSRRALVNAHKFLSHGSVEVTGG